MRMRVPIGACANVAHILSVVYDPPIELVIWHLADLKNASCLLKGNIVVGLTSDESFSEFISKDQTLKKKGIFYVKMGSINLFSQNLFAANIWNFIEKFCD